MINEKIGLIKRSRMWLMMIYVTLCLVSAELTHAKTADYWWLQVSNHILVHSIVDGDTVQIDPRFHPADRQSAIAIHPTDRSCWVTDSFQGRVTQYTLQHKTFSLSGFAAPVALALDPRSNTLWLADAALHFVTQVSMAGKTLQRIEVNSPKALAIGPDGNCWVLTWRGIQPIVNGKVEPPIQPEVKYIANTPDATALWSVNRKGHVYRFDTSGMQRLPFALPDCMGIVGASDGGCWLLTPKQAVRISERMELVGEVTGFDSPKMLVAQPTDGSVWVIDSVYNRAIQLPERDTPSSKQLVVLVGWDSVVNTGHLKREMANALHWESVVPPRSDASPPVTEPPQLAAPSTQPSGETPETTPQLETSPPAPLLEGEGGNPFVTARLMRAARCSASRSSRRCFLVISASILVV